VLLDSIMHADMAPLAPFASSNAMLGAVSLRALHLGCVASGAAGVALLGIGCVAATRRRPA
jgi:hypothetical protein